MGSRLRVFLTVEQDRTLRELRTADYLPQRVRDRAEVIRLNAHGWTVEKIASYFGTQRIQGGLLQSPPRISRLVWKASQLMC